MWRQARWIGFNPAIRSHPWIKWCSFRRGRLRRWRRSDVAVLHGLSAPVVDAPIANDDVQPAGQFLDANPIEMAVQLQERFSGQVLGDVVAADAFQGIAKHGRRVLAVDRFERLHMALRAAGARGKKTRTQHFPTGLES